jgi:general secretion pathway protein D
MEIEVNRLRDLGGELTMLFGGQTPARNLTGVGGVNEEPPTFSTLLNLPSDYFQNISAFNVRGILRALQSRSDVNILSTPQVLTSDNQKAEIVVGENRPFVTGQSQTSGGNTLTTIERRDVGVTLRLTPQILESDLVKLDVFQEISTVAESVAQSIGSVVVGPTTNKRSATTSVLVQDGQTAVIGGLMRDNLVVTERKIPLLGDIPVLGWLFKFRSKRTEKTNLLIFLTPTIVKSPHDLARLKTEKSDGMTRYLDELSVGASGGQRAVLDGVNPPEPKE